MPYVGATLKERKTCPLFHKRKKLRIPTGIPEDITIWPWLFDSSYARNRHSHPDQTGGFLDGETSEFLSYSEVKDLSTYLSTALTQKYGVGQGTNVAVFTANSIYYPVAMFGIIRVGGIFTGSSPDYGVEEAGHILRASTAKLIVADKGSLKVIKTAAKRLGIPDDRIVLLDASLDGHVSIKDLIEDGRKANKQVPAWQLTPGKSNKNACGFVSFTSGTTSLPKGVMISHGNFIAQLMQMASLGRDDLPKVVLSVLPLFHITGLVQLLQLPIVLNQIVVVLAKFDMKSMLDTIIKHRCDELWMVPRKHPYAL